MMTAFGHLKPACQRHSSGNNMDYGKYGDVLIIGYCEVLILAEATKLTSK